MSSTLAPTFAHRAFRVEEQHVYPLSSYPEFARAPSPAPQGMGGTWWYVPTPAYLFYPQPDREYYSPTPLVDRSEAIMWVAKVSSDAVHDDLWRFFTQLVDGAGGGNTNGAGGNTNGTGSNTANQRTTRAAPLSIFRISRSRCAFVDHATQAQLEAAISHFDGVTVRAACGACRARRRDDDPVCLCALIELEEED
ncbi:hypothetical protein C8R44DRAFT_785967 [Mycena epipterygia]|nr:hypothetical protein C8R44DRAFT_785967 [Mycena epipterygia]